MRRRGSVGQTIHCFIASKNAEIFPAFTIGMVRRNSVSSCADKLSGGFVGYLMLKPTETGCWRNIQSCSTMLDEPIVDIPAQKLGFGSDPHRRKKSLAVVKMTGRRIPCASLRQ